MFYQVIHIFLIQRWHSPRYHKEARGIQLWKNTQYQEPGNSIEDILLASGTDAPICSPFSLGYLY